MRELDKKKCYDLSELTSDELKEVANYVQKNNLNQSRKKTARWLESFTEQGYKLKFNKETGWSFEWIEEDYVSTKELFYTLENIQVDCSELSDEQIEKVSDIYHKNKIIPILTIDGFIAHNRSFILTTITYEKFMELFGNKEKSEYFNILAEVLNEELTEEAYKGTEYEVKYIAEKPKQYQIGIDTFERCEANMTKEEILACVRMNIDKYTWRNKGQDLEDLEKIIAYANWGIKQLNKP